MTICVSGSSCDHFQGVPVMLLDDATELVEDDLDLTELGGDRTCPVRRASSR